MQKIYTLLLILFAGPVVDAQTNHPCVPCLPDGIVFTTQAQIDSFPLNFPNCTQILGDVYIGPSNDITDLGGLFGLNSISRHLWITQNSNLLSLSGLDNVVSIDEGVSIEHNPRLKSFEGLNNLTHIGFNPNGYCLHIYGNDSLEALSGLDNLSTIEFDLTIRCNPRLQSLDGLHSVTVINYLLYIGENHTLVDLSGLENVTPIYNTEVHIVSNNSLISLAGLENFPASLILNLSVRWNPLLSDCSIKSICDYLSNPNGYTAISENTIGCNSVEEVKDSCGITAVEPVIPESSFIIYPSITSTIITIETHALGSLSFFNDNGLQVLRQKITAPSTSIDVSGLKSGVYLVKFVGIKSTQVGKFIKQ